MSSEGPDRKLVDVSRPTHATRQRAAYLRAEADALIRRSQDTRKSAHQSSQTARLLMAICIKNAFLPAWHARERSPNLLSAHIDPSRARTHHRE